jgi:hypothetical protein
MLSRLAAIAAIGILIVQGTAIAAPTAHTSARTLECGSFKYGSDGLQPGPADVTALHVSCRVARQLALAGTEPGWRCRLVEGLKFKCTRRNEVVTYFGE